jgi:DNA-binding transcriptional ArsR family regulator
LDALFEVLADAKRRHVLAYLDECDGDVATVTEVRDALADDDASTDERERIATRLHHAHLPKLAAAGLVEFDDRGGTIRFRAGPEISDWLELVRSD